MPSYKTTCFGYRLDFAEKVEPVKMGSVVSQIRGDTQPDFRNPPSFDPLYGFPNGRQERSKEKFFF